MHLLVVERAEAADGRHVRRMDWQFSGYVVITSSVLTQILLQLQLSLKKLLALLL